MMGDKVERQGRNFTSSAEHGASIDLLSWRSVQKRPQQEFHSRSSYFVSLATSIGSFSLFSSFCISSSYLSASRHAFR